MEFRYIDEDSSRLAALVAEEIHLTDLPGDLEDEAVAQGMEEIPASVAGRGMHMNFLGSYLVEPCEPSDGAFIHPESPMNDRNVRIAINHAIDRDAINQAFFGGELEHLVAEYWRPELPGYNPEWEDRWEELYGYNPDEAVRLLEEAGYGPGELRVEMIATDQGGSEGPDVVEAVAGMLSDVGIDAPIVPLDRATQREIRQELTYVSAMEFDDSSSEQITGFIAQGIGCRETGRGRGPESQEISALYAEVVAELDPEAQAELWMELGDMVFEYVNHVPLGRLAQSFVANPEVVADYTFAGYNMTAPYAFFEYVTPA